MNLSQNIVEADDDDIRGESAFYHIPTMPKTYHTRQADFKTGS
jgi:hypothetical protein